MKTIELKEKFRKALEDKGLYNKFMNNLKNYCKKFELSENIHVRELNESNDIVEVIYSGFLWAETEEGSSFWINAKNMFCEFKNKNKEKNKMKITSFTSLCLALSLISLISTISTISTIKEIRRQQK